MLQVVRAHYESHHGVKITDEALEAAVKLSDRYINDRFLPDKAIDVMDEAASALRLEPSSSGLHGPETVSDLERSWPRFRPRRRPQRWPRTTSRPPRCASTRCW